MCFLYKIIPLKGKLIGINYSCHIENVVVKGDGKKKINLQGVCGFILNGNDFWDCEFSICLNYVK